MDMDTGFEKLRECADRIIWCRDGSWVSDRETDSAIAAYFGILLRVAEEAYMNTYSVEQKYDAIKEFEKEWLGSLEGDSIVNETEFIRKGREKHEAILDRINEKLAKG